MKKIILGCSVLLSTGLLFVGCNKEVNKEPEQDTEIQSTKDVAYATNTVADIDQLIQYMADANYNASIYQPSSSITITPDTSANKKVTVTFTGSVTCRDGKKRNGNIVVSFSNPDPNARYYRKPNYTATVTLNNYWVDGWRVDDIGPFIIKNITPFPVGGNQLKWTIDGHISIANANDSMTWKGLLTKTLVNTGDPKVYSSTGSFPINWNVTYTVGGIPSPNTPGAVVEYEGSAKGVTSKSKPYELQIDPLKEKKFLVRRYSCSPDQVVAYTTTTTQPVIALPVYSDRHPFVGGIASFTTNSLPDARKIDFSDNGTEGCDNSGSVIIRGIQHPVDFPK